MRVRGEGGREGGREGRVLYHTDTVLLQEGQCEWGGGGEGSFITQILSCFRRDSVSGGGGKERGGSDHFYIL